MAKIARIIRSFHRWSLRRSMELQTLIKQLLIVLTVGALSACASTGEAPRSADRDINSGGSDCISIRTIRDYTPLDDRNLLIWGPAKRAYHVSLFRPAMELRSSFEMGFSSRDDQLCPFGGDGIVIGPFRQETIGIQSITRLSADQADELLIRHGRKEPAEQPAPAPEDVKGAEVEELG
jgi:hypothetical protein